MGTIRRVQSIRSLPVSPRSHDVDARNKVFEWMIVDAQAIQTNEIIVFIIQLQILVFHILSSLQENVRRWAILSQFLCDIKNMTCMCDFFLSDVTFSKEMPKFY